MLASEDIFIRKPVIVEGQSAVKILPQVSLTFAGGGRVAFWDPQSTLMIGSSSFTLIDGIAGIARAIGDVRTAIALADAVPSRTARRVRFLSLERGAGHRQ